MNYFYYKLIEQTGNIAQGMIKLPYDTELSALIYLERQGNTVIMIKRLMDVWAKPLLFISALSQRKVTRTELAEVLANLSVMLKSGITVLDGLTEIAQALPHPRLRDAIEGVIFHLASGSSVTGAVSHYPRIFTPMVVQLIRIGEETGALDRTLKDAAQHLQRVQTIISDTKQALIYPLFIISAMGFAMLFWFYFVVPTIVDLFQEMNITLPPITMAILNISLFIQHTLFYIGLFILFAALLLISLLKKHRGVRKFMHKLLSTLPVVGRLRAASNLAFITEYFNLLLATGIDIFRTLAIIQDAVQDEVYKAKIQGLSESISNGLSVTDAFRQANFFPSFIVRMIAVGEQTGSLSAQLELIAHEYRQRLATTIKNIGQLIEPLIIIFAGSIFAVIVAGLFLPIYDLIDALAV